MSLPTEELAAKAHHMGKCMSTRVAVTARIITPIHLKLQAGGEGAGTKRATRHQPGTAALVAVQLESRSPPAPWPSCGDGQLSRAEAAKWKRLLRSARSCWRSGSPLGNGHGGGGEEDGLGDGGASVAARADEAGGHAQAAAGDERSDACGRGRARGGALVACTSQHASVPGGECCARNWCCRCRAASMHAADLPPSWAPAAWPHRR